jgi:Ras family
MPFLMRIYEGTRIIFSGASQASSPANTILLIFGGMIFVGVGQERFRSMAPMYYRGAKAAICVFDVTNEETFQRVGSWLRDLRAHADPNCVVCLAGKLLLLVHRIAFVGFSIRRDSIPLILTSKTCSSYRK